MEGYASFGAIGLVIYPFIFMFPLLMILSRISSFRHTAVVSIFLFSIYQHIFTELTSEAILSELTRGVPFYFCMLYVLDRIAHDRALLSARKHAI